jgi:tRNA dimethylallyltransferase
MKTMRERLVAIVGPTGVGKSRIALRVAQELGAEIVGADSRQVYLGMDIGTAKPGPQERRLVPHHLIDIVEPNGDFSLARYQQLAYETIAAVEGRGKIPFLVGGTGLYVWAVVEGWDIPRVAPDTRFRQHLEARAALGEGDTLFRELAQVDPESAQRIDPRNVRRVIRALEVSRTAAVPFSRLRRKTPPPFETRIIGLTMERAALYRRLDARVDHMIADGLVEEVRRLVEMGYGFELTAMSGIGYGQIGRFLAGNMTLEAAVEQIKTETRHFARRQYNWFRLSDERIAWFNVEDGAAEEQVLATVAAFATAPIQE